jgi:hypothetical protein
LWRNRSSLTRAVRRWKAPWVQRIALLFAGERVRRPWYGRRGLREVRRQARREARKRLASSAPPAGDVTSERHGVSGSIGLGQSFGARAIASGGAAPRRKPLRPLARDTLGWPRITIAATRTRMRRHLPYELHARATSRGVGRARTVQRSCSRTVSIAEVDERHVAPRAARVKNPRRAEGLASKRESASK